MTQIGIHWLGRTLKMLTTGLLGIGYALSPALAQPSLTDPEIANAVDEPFKVAPFKWTTI